MHDRVWAVPAALAEDGEHHFGFLHFAYLRSFRRPVTCAPSPCGPPLAVARLAGRYPCDYYGHSVAPDRSRAGVDPTFALPYVSSVT